MQLVGARMQEDKTIFVFNLPGSPQAGSRLIWGPQHPETGILYPTDFLTFIPLRPLKQGDVY